MSKTSAITYRWQFVAPDFNGWPDGRPWTRMVAGPMHKGPVPEGADGPPCEMPQKWIDQIADHLEELTRAFELQRNDEEARWRRARCRTSERTLLIRVRVVPTEETCEGVPLAREAS
jgi:hypothetical protein